MSQVYFAKVKSIQSADTLVLSSKSGKERTLSLAYLQAPRLQANEKYAFESRELLRKLLVGKQIKFWIIYKTNNGREFGDISTPLFSSLIEYILSNGAAKLRDNANAFDEADEFEKFQIAQEKAKSENIGIWDSTVRPIKVIDRPTSDQISASVTTPVDAIVEKVISGDRILVRLILSLSTQSVIPVLVAGVKAPRSSSQEEDGEPLGDEAKKFVEDKLAGQSIKISLIGESSNGSLIAKISHPAGNISEKILAEGFAEVSDWQSTIIGAKGMSILRKHEKDARSAGKNLWKGHVTSSATCQLSGDSTVKVGNLLHAIISRIISADTIVLRLKDDSEITVQLASIRGPRASDSIQASFVPIAKEFLRKKLIGKNVTATVESIREANEQFDERAMVTIRTVSGANIGEELVSQGYATVIRYRKGEQRPDYWDLLIECETFAINNKKGMHGKPIPAEKIVDASENAARAKPYLFSFQNRTSISGVVEHVISGNRFKIVIPKEGVKLTLVLGGLSNPGSRDDEFSLKALDLANKKFYQREINFEIYGADRVGSFIGNIFAPGSKDPFQTTLLKDGLVETHERSLAQTKFGNQLSAAENEAKSKKIGIWVNYDPSKDVEQVTNQISELKIEKKYVDAKVCEILSDGTIAIQIQNEESKKLKSFMEKFRSAASTFTSVKSTPKRGELVAAKLSDNGKYYRAKVRSINKSTNKAEVQHVDYGTIESVPIAELKSIPSEFSLTSYKSQSHICQLSLIRIPPPSQEEYRQEAIYYLEDTLLDKQVVACITFEHPTSDVEFDVEIYDSETISKDPSRTVNKDFVKAGWGLVKKNRLHPLESLLTSERVALLQLEEEAKKKHIGCWEFGDIEGDEEF
ncbi:hypothetical protein DAMA08_049910 [Martiniozyma asiatica (nom. inval.)]|nr:hypothetical protein DAMA08_049910 [Martiniozyma asiatica]